MRLSQSKCLSILLLEMRIINFALANCHFQTCVPLSRHSGQNGLYSLLSKRTLIIIIQLSFNHSIWMNRNCYVQIDYIHRENFSHKIQEIFRWKNCLGKVDTKSRAWICNWNPVVNFMQKKTEIISKSERKSQLNWSRSRMNCIAAWSVIIDAMEPIYKRYWFAMSFCFQVRFKSDDVKII